MYPRPLPEVTNTPPAKTKETSFISNLFGKGNTALFYFFISLRELAPYYLIVNFINSRFRHFCLSNTFLDIISEASTRPINNQSIKLWKYPYGEHGFEYECPEKILNESLYKKIISYRTNLKNPSYMDNDLTVFMPCDTNKTASDINEVLNPLLLGNSYIVLISVIGAMLATYASYTRIQQDRALQSHERKNYTTISLLTLYSIMVIMTTMGATIGDQEDIFAAFVPAPCFNQSVTQDTLDTNIFYTPLSFKWGLSTTSFWRTNSLELMGEACVFTLIIPTIVTCLPNWGRLCYNITCSKNNARQAKTKDQLTIEHMTTRSSGTAPNTLFQDRALFHADHSERIDIHKSHSNSNQY